MLVRWPSPEFLAALAGLNGLSSTASVGEVTFAGLRGVPPASAPPRALALGPHRHAGVATW